MTELDDTEQKSILIEQVHIIEADEVDEIEVMVQNLDDLELEVDDLLDTVLVVMVDGLDVLQQHIDEVEVDELETVVQVDEIDVNEQ